MQSIKDAIIKEGLTLDETLERFEELGHWELRQLWRDAQRMAQLETIDPSDVLQSSPVKALGKKADMLLRAGFFRSVTVNVKPVKSKPIFDKAGVTRLVVCDPHYPYHDPHAHDVAIQIGQAVGPDEVIINGDGLDAHALSSKTKDPNRPFAWVEERNEGISYLGQWRAAFDVPIHYGYGNHEWRVQKYLSENAPELIGAVSLDGLLGLDASELDFQIDKDCYFWRANDQLLIKHGTRIRSDAGNSVREEIKKAGVSIIMGHVHRRALIEVTLTINNREGVLPLVGVEGGGLFDLNPFYAPDGVNWQQGVVLVTEFDNGLFDVELVKIFRGAAFFRGRLFRSRV